MTAYQLIEFYNIATLDRLNTLLTQGLISEEDAEIIAGLLLDC